MKPPGFSFRILSPSNVKASLNPGTMIVSHPLCHPRSLQPTPPPLFFFLLYPIKLQRLPNFDFCHRPPGHRLLWFVEICLSNLPSHPGFHCSAIDTASSSSPILACRELRTIWRDSPGMWPAHMRMHLSIHPHTAFALYGMTRRMRLEYSRRGISRSLFERPATTILGAGIVLQSMQVFVWPPNPNLHTVKTSHAPSD